MNLRLSIVFATSVLFVFASIAFAQDMVPRPRLISVKGTADINVAPDRVRFELAVNTHDKDLKIAKSQHDERIKKVIGLAHGAGIESKDIETSQLKMGPDYSEEKVPKFIGYEVSQTIDITLKDLSKYESLMTAFLNAGVDRVNDITFFVGETRKYKDQARAEALRAAKEKATAMAAELGQTIGKPWSIDENAGGGYSFYANSTGESNVRVSEEEATVAPGQVTIRAAVMVSFLLE